MAKQGASETPEMDRKICKERIQTYNLANDEYQSHKIGLIILDVGVRRREDATPRRVGFSYEADEKVTLHTFVHGLTAGLSHISETYGF